jgi:putative FmdB family regulatory protein
MPTYEYRCPKGHEFERFQKMTEPARAKCPVCGRSAVRQISGGAGLIFKGSGFYITDYGKDGKGPRTEKDGETKAETPPAKAEECTAAAEPSGKSEPAAKSDKSERGDQGAKSEKGEKGDGPARDKKSTKKKAAS